jgi:hypothetical protein
MREHQVSVYMIPYQANQCGLVLGMMGKVSLVLQQTQYYL